MADQRPKPVILESPFAPGTRVILRYLRECIRDSLKRGEAPFASHAIYPGVLNDNVPAERAQGIAAGFVWRPLAQATVVYIDLGVSRGMQAGIDNATALGQPIEYRRLGGEWTEIGRASTPHKAIE